MKSLLEAIALLVSLWILLVLVLVATGRRTHARELATSVPNLIRLFKGLAGDPRVPRGSKWWLVVALAWFAWPIDLLPEFLPVIGPIDDLVVAALVLRHLLKRAGPEVISEHWSGGENGLRLILRVAGAG